MFNSVLLGIFVKAVSARNGPVSETIVPSAEWPGLEIHQPTRMPEKDLAASGYQALFHQAHQAVPALAGIGRIQKHAGASRGPCDLQQRLSGLFVTAIHPVIHELHGR